MKTVLLVFGMLLTGVLSFGQKPQKFFLNEFQVSLNRTTVKDSNTEDRYGFGFGAYHSFRSEQKLNIFLGFEYNRVQHFKNFLSEGRWSILSDMTYTYNFFSVPLGLRLNIGESRRFFIEQGVFADLVLGAHRSGMRGSSVPLGNLVVTDLKEADEKVSVTSSYGLSIGFGFRVPISGFELTIKPDYKFGVLGFTSEFDGFYNRYLRLNLGVDF